MHKQNFLTKLFRKYLKTATKTQCLKIKEKVSFNIASEASYVYKKANSASFWKAEDCGQKVVPDRLILKRQN